MNKRIPTAPSTIAYILLIALAVASSWILHEFAHWCAGEATGNAMAMTLNTTYPVSGNYLHHHDHFYVDAAGPLFTLLEAFLFFALLTRTGNIRYFPFLLTCLYMRTLAGFLNFVNLNDEGRLSQEHGIGKYTLSILVVAILFTLTYRAVKKEKIRTRLVVLTLLGILVFSSLLILADQTWHLRII